MFVLKGLYFLLVNIILNNLIESRIVFISYSKVLIPCQISSIKDR